MDLLCITPMYDRYLCNALREKIVDVSLGAISFHYDPDYFRHHGVRRHRAVVDLVSCSAIRNRKVRQGLKAVECMVNLLVLLVCFTIKRPDIVHVQWIPLVTKSPLELWFLNLLRRLGTKVVYTVHNLLPHDTGTRYADLFSKVYRDMDALICHTEGTKSDLVRELNVAPEKVHVIPHGPMFHDGRKTDPADFRRKHDLGSADVIVLFQGIIKPYKGLEFLLQAWPAVAAKHPGAKLVVAGNADSGYLDKLRNEIARLGIEGTVRTIFGFIPDRDIPVLFEAADILVYPYQRITQSGALLTGMAFAKAIVATAVGGFTETLSNEETALLVDYGDHRQLADSLLRLIEDESARERLGKAVHAELQKNYSWESIADRTLECYGKVLTA